MQQELSSFESYRTNPT